MSSSSTCTIYCPFYGWEEVAGLAHIFRHQHLIPNTYTQAYSYSCPATKKPIKEGGLSSEHLDDDTASYSAKLSAFINLPSH